MACKVRYNFFLQRWYNRNDFVFLMGLGLIAIFQGLFFSKLLFLMALAFCLIAGASCTKCRWHGFQKIFLK